MPFSFPASPTVGQTSTQNGRQYVYAGNNTWELVAASGGGSLSATVTIPAAGDQYWDSVKLLLRGNGSNNGTIFADTGPAAKSVTRVGSTVTSTAQSKFGGASLYFDGSDSVLEVGSAYDTDIAGFGTGDFTIEMWFRTASTSRMSVLSAYNVAASPATGLVLQLNKDDGGGPISGSINFGYGDSSLVSTTGGKWSTNTWHHLAVVRSGTALVIYVDGVSQGSATNSTDIASGTKLSLGGLFAGGYIQDYTGYIDDVRITRAARYTGTFTPPTATYQIGTYTAAQTLPVTITGSGGGSGLSWSSVPASATASGTAGQIAHDASRIYVCTATNTWKRTLISSWVSDPYFADVVLLMHGDGSFTDSSSYARAATSYDAVSASGSAKFGSGSLSFDGTNDYLSFPTATSLDLGNTYTIEAWIYPNSSSLSGGVVSRSLYYSTGSNGELSGTWGGCTASIRGIDSAMRFYFFATNNTNEQYVDVSQSYFPANTWTHVAMVRSGTTGTIYADGAQVGTISGLNSTSANSQPLLIGTWKYVVAGSDTFAGYWNGRIDDLRITKGVARTITVPTAAYPDE
jgi:hypothetical protein